jgi:hypothetical protein
MRTAKGLNRRQFSMLMKLYEKQPWLMEREPAIEELIDICKDLDGQVLISNLLKRFKFLSSRESSELITQMAKQIAEGWGFRLQETQIVAIAPDYDPDSSQLILQMLKVELSKIGWGDVKLVTRIWNSVKNLPKYPKIVLVDEFVGSGTTMAKRIRDVKKSYEAEVKQGRAPKEYDIKVCVLATIVNAIKVVEETGIEMYSALQLKKGISGYLTGKLFKKAIKRMLRLESKLKPHINDISLPPLGWGRAEALYGMEGGNTPNSVFPLFWWPRFADGRERQTLLHRQERGLS